MEQIPDAPWIRDAEMNGMPSPETILCPCCGESCKTIYEGSGLVFGCEHCVKEWDSWEWQENERLASRPDWADEREE